MKGKIDRTFTKQAFKNLEIGMGKEEKLAARREEQRFKAVDLPCSLYDALMGLSKSEMDAIRRNYGFKNLSSLNKADLAKGLAVLIPIMVQPVLETMDQASYDLLQKEAENSGVSAVAAIPVVWVDAIQGWGLLFPGKIGKENILFMPKELMKVLPELHTEKLQGILERNTEWIHLAQGLLYYYGVLDLPTLLTKISQFTGKPVHHWELISVLAFASKCYGRIQYTENGGLYGYKDARAADSKKIAAQQGRRTDLDYYPFSKEQLLQAGEMDHFDRTPEMGRFLSFLRRNYGMKEAAAGEFAMEIIAMIQNDAALNEMLQFLQNHLEFSSFDSLLEINQVLMDLNNSTRQWALKGHTPNELFKEERGHLNPLPVIPHAAVPPYAQGLPQRTPEASSNSLAKGTSAPVQEETAPQKIGRNDPCPCGKGKKYKKCCGK